MKVINGKLFSTANLMAKLGENESMNISASGISQKKIGLSYDSLLFKEINSSIKLSVQEKKIQLDLNFAKPLSKEETLLFVHNFPNKGINH